MLNRVTQYNIQFFTEHVNDFTKDYFDNAEKFVVRHYFKGKKVLVLGCGAGRTLIPLYKMGFSVTGIDITPKMVEAAQKKVKNLPIKVFLMDATKLIFPNTSFDIVFFPFHGIDYIHPDIYKAVMEAKRVLKPGGTFIFNSHNRLNLKALPRFFEGRYANYYGLITYRVSPIDKFRLKKYFKTVEVIPQTKILVEWKKASWKEKIYKLLPHFDASIYFICKNNG